MKNCMSVCYFQRGRRNLLSVCDNKNQFGMTFQMLYISNRLRVFFISMSSLEILLFIPASSKTMWEPSLVVWTFFILTLLSITFLSKILKNGKYIGQDDQSQRRYKFPPGRRSWPVIGDSFHWYSAIASSHPSKYVEEQAKR